MSADQEKSNADVSGENPTSESFAQPTQASEATRAAVDYRDETHDRHLPGIREILSPANLARWSWGLIEGWFLSRPYGRLAAAAPFLVMAIGGSAFVWWLRSAPKDTAVVEYEAAIERATENEDFEKAGLYLRALTALRPHNRQYAFRMATHEFEHGDRNEALRVFGSLTGEDGYLPARTWLVEKSLGLDPLVSLTDDQLEGQLLQILKKNPTAVRANQLLADLYLRQGQLQQAEDRLTKIVNDVPALGLPLARIQRRLGRDAEPIERHLKLAEEFHREQLLQNRKNYLARAMRAEALAELGQAADAQRLLQEGLEEASDEARALLTKTLSKVYSQAATQRLATSALNREAGAGMLAASLKIDPSNLDSLQKMVALWQTGTTFPEGTFDRSIEFLRETQSADPDKRLLLAQALAASGKFDQSVGILKPLSDEIPRLRLTLVRMLKTSQQETEAGELTRTLLEEYVANPDEDDTSLAASLMRAEVLHVAEQYQACVDELEGHRPENADSPSQIERLRWRQLYGKSKLALFDLKRNSESFANAQEAVEMLNAAFSSGTVTIPVVNRLAELSNGDDEFAAVADEALNRLLASGLATPLVYNVLGTQALQSENYGKAVQYLTRSNSLRRNDPMVMNNLALAHVRASSGDARRALQLINATLEIIPEHPDALSTRGEVYVAMAEWEDARADLEKALIQRQDSRNVRELLVRVFDELGESALADVHRDFLEKLGP